MELVWERTVPNLPSPTVVNLHPQETYLAGVFFTIRFSYSGFRPVTEAHTLL